MCWKLQINNSEEYCIHFKELFAADNIFRIVKGDNVSGSSAQRLSLSLLDIHVFISSSMFTSHIRLSATETWGEFGIDPTTTPTPLLPIHNNPPTKATFHPPLVERIPICPGAKFQRCFARAERPAASCLPWEDPHTPPPFPQGQKMLQMIEGANAESFLLTPDRYCSGSELRLPDTLGDGGDKYCSELPLLHHVLLLCHIEHSLQDHFHHDKEVRSFMSQLYASKSCGLSYAVHPVVDTSRWPHRLANVWKMDVSVQQQNCISVLPTRIWNVM